MIVHIILENGEEINLISYCKRRKISFMNCCLKYCSGMTFEEILGLPSERIKIIYLGKEEEEGENG